MPNIQQPTVNPNLEKFVKGFHHFHTLNVCENFIVFKLPSPKRAAEAAEKAQERINKMNLPLSVITNGERANTYIVKAA